MDQNVSEYNNEYVSEYSSKYVSEYTSEYISECTSERSMDYVFWGCCFRHWCIH